MLKNKLTCEIHYFETDHLKQIYDGFEKLAKDGIINLSVKKAMNYNSFKAFCTVIINDKFKVIYDAMDGMIWNDNGKKSNATYFNQNFNDVDFYFKRSFEKLFIEKYKPKKLKIFPLGLNYYIENSGLIIPNKNNRIYKIILPKYNIKKLNSPIFEQEPILHPIDKILFYTRLWDPSVAISSTYKKEWQE